MSYEHFNHEDQLPPVDTPLIILMPCGRLERVTRTKFAVAKSDDLEYVRGDGKTITGKYRWTYE